MWSRLRALFSRQPFKFLGFFALLVLVVGLLASIALRLPAVQDFLIASAFRSLSTSSSAPDRWAEDADTLRVLVCGSASPLPDPSRAGPCLLVFAGGKLYLVDAGPGSSRKLLSWRVPMVKLAAVLLTHFHSDHIGALGDMHLYSWTGGRPGPLPIYGPRGIGEVVGGFNQAYRLDSGYRTAHHGPTVADPATAAMLPRLVDAPERGEIEVLRDGELRVTAFAVEHFPATPALGYRFSYRGRSLVISGDTAPSDNLEQAAQGTDLLIHEAQDNRVVAQVEQIMRGQGNLRIATVMKDIRTYHSSPVEAARSASRAGAKYLLLYHLTPPPQNRLMERAFVRGLERVYAGPWQLARDGVFIELPVNSRHIETGRL